MMCYNLKKKRISIVSVDMGNHFPKIFCWFSKILKTVFDHFEENLETRFSGTLEMDKLSVS